MPRKDPERFISDARNGTDEHLTPLLVEHYDGTLFNPLSPPEELFSCEYLSRPLANCARYGGMTEDFYSTAQHSVLVALLSDNGEEDQKAALLHDAEEATGLPDMLTPIKMFNESYVRNQRRIGLRILAYHQVDPTALLRIKSADRQSMIIESRALKADFNADYWNDVAKGENAPEHIHVRPLDPKPARKLFEAAYVRVFIENKPITEEWAKKQDGFLVEVRAPASETEEAPAPAP